MKLSGFCRVNIKSEDGSKGTLYETNEIKHLGWVDEIRKLCATGAYNSSDCVPTAVSVTVQPSFDTGSFADLAAFTSYFNSQQFGGGTAANGVTYSSSEYSQVATTSDMNALFTADSITKTGSFSSFQVSPVTTVGNNKSITVTYITQPIGGSSESWNTNWAFGHIDNVKLEGGVADNVFAEVANFSDVGGSSPNIFSGDTVDGSSFWFSDELTIEYSVTLTVSNNFEDNYLSSLAERMYSSNNISDVGIKYIKVKDEADSYMTLVKDDGTESAQIDIATNQNTNPFEFVIPEFTMVENTTPTTLEIYSDEGLLASTIDISHDLVWNPLDSLRLTYKLT